MNQIDLKGRVAVVTGGAQGIGYATAERMLRSGASVVLWDIDAARLDEADAARCRRTGGSRRCGRAHRRRGGRRSRRGARWPSTAASTSWSTTPASPAATATTWELDAGGLAPRRRGQPDRAVPHLPRRRAADDRAGYGRIVNIASVAGKEGNPNASHYSASKAGADRADQVAGQGAGDAGRARQRGHAGGGEDRDVRDDDATAHRLHAVEDPDGRASSRSARSRR